MSKHGTPIGQPQFLLVLDYQTSCLSPSTRFQVGSFSLVKDGLEVDLLKFNRWVRVLATLDRETNGMLYRCKAVLAQAGSTRKLVFHAVADVVEQQELGEWREGETRGCKIVFIGKKLNQQWFEEVCCIASHSMASPTLQPLPRPHNPQRHGSSHEEQMHLLRHEHERTPGMVSGLI